jgi:hypothetical protein
MNIQRKKNVKCDFRTPPPLGVKKESRGRIKLIFAAGALLTVLWLGILVYATRELISRVLN